MRISLVLLLTCLAGHAQPFMLGDPAIAGRPRVQVFDADALAFFSKLGGVSSTISNGVDAFCKTLKADGTWTNLAFLYPMVGNNIGSNCVNLVSTNFYGVPHGSFTVANSTGIQSDGSSGYIDTLWRGTNNPTSNGIFVFLKTNSAVLNYKVPMGARDSGGTTYISFTQAGSTLYWWSDAYNVANSVVLSGATPSLILIQRTNSTVKEGYLNAQAPSVSTDSGGATPPPAFNVFLCAMDNNGTAASYFDGKIQMAGALNTAMSASQVTTLYNAIIALNTALAR